MIEARSLMGSGPVSVFPLCILRVLRVFLW